MRAASAAGEGPDKCAKEPRVGKMCPSGSRLLRIYSESMIPLIVDKAVFAVSSKLILNCSSKSR